jgi:hypothetical protein
MTATSERTTAVKTQIPTGGSGLRHVERVTRNPKARLLAMALPTIGDPDHLKLLRLAAVEAEALAWLTPFPHLFLPVLLEEKLATARRYVAHQERVRAPERNASGLHDDREV